MKDFKYYENEAKKELIEAITEGLKTGPVRIAVDLVVKSIKDVDKASTQHAMKRIRRNIARSKMEKAKIPAIRMITPVPRSKMNGISLDEGIVLPVYAPMILDPNEITEDQMILGLFMMLQKTYDEYYLKLLKSFPIDREVMTPEFLEMVDGDKKKYWRKRKISTKIKK